MPGNAASKLAAIEGAVTRRPMAAATLLAVFLFVSCYFRLFIFPHLPLLPGGDVIGFFFSGSRILAGDLPYRDFAEALPAGTDLFYASVIKLFGFYTWVPDMVMTLLAAGTGLLLALVARRVTSGFAIFLPGLMLVNFAMPNEAFNATHHWFSVPLAIAAILVLLGGASFSRVAAAGAFGGLATCFTQTTGGLVLAAMAIYIVCRSGAKDDPGRWRKVALILAMSLAVFAAVNGYFIWRAGFGQWFASVVIFPARYFRIPAINNWRVVKIDFRNHPTVSRWLTFPLLYAAVPFACAVFAIVLRRRERGDQPELWDRLFLVSLCALAMFLAVISAPSLLRLSSASPPTMVLIAWVLGRDGKMTRVAKIAAVSVTTLIAIAVPIQHQRRWHAGLDLPGGKTGFTDPVTYEEDRSIQDRVHPGQYFFGMPMMYLPFHLLNPAPIVALDKTDYTRPEQVAAAVRGLEAHDVPMMIIRDMPTPATGQTNDNSGPFWEFVRANYRPTKAFPNGDVVWERIP